MTLIIVFRLLASNVENIVALPKESVHLSVHGMGNKSSFVKALSLL